MKLFLSLKQMLSKLLVLLVSYPFQLIKSKAATIKHNTRYLVFFSLSILIHFFLCIELFPSPPKELLKIIKAQIYTQTETRLFYGPLPKGKLLDSLQLFAGMKAIYVKDPAQTQKLEKLVQKYKNRSKEFIQQNHPQCVAEQKQLIQRLETLIPRFQKIQQKLNKIKSKTPSQLKQTKKLKSFLSHMAKAQKYMTLVPPLLEKNNIPFSVGYQADTLFHLWEAYKLLIPRKQNKELSIKLNKPKDKLAEKLKELEKVAKEIEKTRKKMEELKKKKNLPPKKEKPKKLAKKEPKKTLPPKPKKIEKKIEKKIKKPKKEEPKKIIKKSKVKPTKKETKKVQFKENIKRTKKKETLEKTTPTPPKKEIKKEEPKKPAAKEVKKEQPKPTIKKAEKKKITPPKQEANPLKKEKELPPKKKQNTPGKKETKKTTKKTVKTTKKEPPKTTPKKAHQERPVPKNVKKAAPHSNTSKNSKPIKTTTKKAPTIQSKKQYQRFVEQAIEDKNFEGVLVPQLRVNTVSHYEWLKISKKLRLQLIAYPKSRTFLLVQKDGNPIALKTQKSILNFLNSYSGRLLDRRLQLPQEYENFKDASQYDPIRDGELRFGNIFPVSYSNYIAWKQFEVCKRNGFEPKKVRYTFAEFRLSSFNQYILLIYKIQLTNGQEVKVKDFEQKLVFGTR